MQRPAVEYLKSKGFGIILCDAQQNPAIYSLADKIIRADIFNHEDFLDNIIRLKNDYNIISAFTVSADCHYPIAYVAEKLNFRVTWDTNISKICKQKDETRLFLQGICQQPCFITADKFEDIRLNRNILLEKEVVMKPVDSSGSRGFQEFKGIDSITNTDFQLTLSKSRTKKVIIEEKISRSIRYLSEISAEAVWYNDAVKITNIVDRIFTFDLPKIKPLNQFIGHTNNSCIEYGHINPSLLPTEKTEEIHKIFRKIFEKLNPSSITTLKLDILIDQKDRPIVLEMTPRTSGGWDSSYSNIAVGGNLQKTLLDYVTRQKNEVETYENVSSVYDAAKRICILAAPKSNAQDCIGREFFSGQTHNLNVKTDVLVSSALEKMKSGETIYETEIKY